MEPKIGEKGFRFVLYLAGGGLANLITGLLVLPLIFITQDGWLRLIFLALVLVLVYMGTTSLIPMSVGGLPNDGQNIQEARKSVDAEYGLYVMLRVNAEASRGRAFADYDADVFSVTDTADANNYFVAYLLQLRSSRLEDLGEYEKSYRLLVLPDPDKLPEYYCTRLILSLVFHELVYFGDTFSIQRARDRLKEREGDRVFQKYMSVSHPAFMPYQAAKVAFIDSDKDRARELIEQTRILNRFQLNPEEERSVTVMLDKLERRMYAVSQEGAASPDVAASPDAGNPDTSNPDEVPNDSLS